MYPVLMTGLGFHCMHNLNSTQLVGSVGALNAAVNCLITC